MKSLRIDKYFDITCSVCGFSRSTDYERGFETNPSRLRKLAKAEGWKSVLSEATDDGTEGTLCPSCASKCRYIRCKKNKTECDFCMVNGYCKVSLKKAEANNNIPYQILYHG